MSKKVIKFRIYPESVHGFYFDVEIHPTVEKMRKAATRSKAYRSDYTDGQAAVCGFSKGRVEESGRTAWFKTLGTMFFHRDRLGMEIITHESTHAALRWMEAQKFSAGDLGESPTGDASENEERFCYALGRIAAQIASKGHEIGLYD